MTRTTAIVYCQGAFETPNGKTAHGLVRFTRRYQVLSVIDGTCAGRDAGELLDGKANGIPVLGSLRDAMEDARKRGTEPTHLVVGLAPDGGRLGSQARGDLLAAIRLGLHVDCGLHDFLSEDPEFAELAHACNVEIRDIRKPPDRRDLHFFSGKIEEVDVPVIAVLGTDSAVGKRTTAWKIVEEVERRGGRAELVGTGQTAWLQGARHSLVLDSLVNDFVSGEIEHAVWSAWDEARPDLIVLEGQGSLLNPAYPGGFELLAAGRPDAVILQHAPARVDYDGFEGYPIHPLPKQIAAVEMVGDKPVVAITLNHETLAAAEIPRWCAAITRITGIETVDVLRDGAAGLVDVLCARLSLELGNG